MKSLSVRLLSWAAAGVSAAFVLGLLGRQHWLLDLLSHFRVQYAAALAACGLGLWLLRRRRRAVAALAAALGVAATVLMHAGAPLPAAQAVTPAFHVQAASPAFRFVTFNQRMGNPGAAAIGAWLESSQADVVALQELDTPLAVQQLAAALPSYPHVQARFGLWSDVTFFSRWPIVSAQDVELSPGGARALLVRIDWRGQPLTLLGVHLHWPMGAHNSRQRDAALQALAALAQAVPGPLLIGGDFNITPWSPVFGAALQASPLADCARGQGLLHSWPTFLAPASIRIDHCLASPHWRVQQVSAGPALGSDHRPMLNQLELKR